jgi:PilZ domain-containing protein
MELSTEKRRDFRIQTHFETSFSSGGQQGSGILGDISYSGALLRQTSLRPRIASQVRVRIFLGEGSPFVVVGQVVRHVEDGFAIEYADLRAEVRQFVDRIAAIVSQPPHVLSDTHSRDTTRREQL